MEINFSLEDNSCVIVNDPVKIFFNKENKIFNYNTITQEKYFLDFPKKNVLFFPSNPNPTFKSTIDNNQGYYIVEILESILKSQKENIPFTLVFTEENYYKIMNLIGLNLDCLNRIMNNIHELSSKNCIVYDHDTLFYDLGYKFRFVTNTGTKEDCVKTILEFTLLREYSKSLNNVVDSFVLTYFDEKIKTSDFSELFSKSSLVTPIIY